MEINFNDPDFIVSVDRELGQKTHEFSELNGYSDKAKLFISTKPFDDPKGLVNHFAKNNKGKYGMFFEKIENAKHQKVLLHMNEEQIIRYLDAKKDADKANLINEAMGILYLLDQMKINAEKIEKKKSEAGSIINSTEKTLEKVKDVDEQVVLNINHKISSLKKALKDSHPDLELMESLINEIKNDAGNLIGEEKIASARRYAEAVISKIEDVLNSSETPLDEKPYFTDRMNHLTHLKNGADAILIEETATQIDRELVEKTDKNIRAEKRAVEGMTRNIIRLILKSMFQIEEEKYDIVLNKIMTKDLASNYSSYLSTRGRITKKLPPLETFLSVENASLDIMVKEMIIVHEGNTGIESVVDSMPGVLNLPNLDLELNNVQMKILRTEDLSEKNRYAKILDFLTEVKIQIRKNMEEMAGYTSEQADDLVKGSIFTNALEMIPSTLTQAFFVYEKNKETHLEPSKIANS